MIVAHWLSSSVLNRVHFFSTELLLLVRAKLKKWTFISEFILCV